MAHTEPAIRLRPITIRSIVFFIIETPLINLRVYTLYLLTFGLSRRCHKFLAQIRHVVRMTTDMHNNDEIDLEIGYHLDTAMVKVSGSLSLFSSTAFKTRIGTLFDKHLKEINLDLSEISHMDTGGLIALMTVAKICSGRRVAFSVVQCSPVVRRLLDASELSYLLPATIA